MSLEDTIIAGVIFERAALCGTGVLDASGMDERVKINHYGRKMLRFADAKRIKKTDSDEDIAAALTAGIWVWLFWQIAPDLLIWIITAIRRRIWDTQQGSTGDR
jgi:hypothetical protein